MREGGYRTTRRVAPLVTLHDLYPWQVVGILTDREGQISADRFRNEYRLVGAHTLTSNDRLNRVLQTQDVTVAPREIEGTQSISRIDAHRERLPRNESW